MNERKHVNILRTLCLCSALCLLLSGCSIGPRNKTMMLREPSPEPAGQTVTGSGQFEIHKQYSFPLEKLDQSGTGTDSGVSVIGWLDNDNLLVLASVSNASGQTEGELGSMSCQYGFYNAILRIEGQLPDCVSLSPDGKLVSYQMYNDEIGKYTLIYSLELSRQILNCESFRTYSAPVWSRDSQKLAAAAVMNGEYGVTVIDVRSGSTERRMEGDETPLAICDQYGDGSVLLQREAQEEGMVSLEMLPSQGGETRSLFVGRVSEASALGPSSALTLSRNTLRYVTVEEGEESASLESAVQAYAFSQDGQYIALAVQNMDGSVDVAVGRWSGNHIVGRHVVYKNIGNSVLRMLFSPDARRLYVENGSETATGATVLEFS